MDISVYWKANQCALLNNNWFLLASFFFLMMMFLLKFCLEVLEGWGMNVFAIPVWILFIQKYISSFIISHCVLLCAGLSHNCLIKWAQIDVCFPLNLFGKLEGEKLKCECFYNFLDSLLIWLYRQWTECDRFTWAI